MTKRDRSSRPKPEVGRLYRVSGGDDFGVVAYEPGCGTWKIPAGEVVLVLEYPTKQRLPNYSGGGKDQWCDVLLSSGRACIVWNMRFLELVEVT